jgi:UPF0755 protein
MRKYFITFIIVLAIGAVFFEIYLPKNPSSTEEMIFSIEKGEGSRDIALNLEKEGLIRWSSIFRLYVLTVGVSGKLQAGDYLLSPSLSISEMADKFVRGDIAREKITIVEGWDLNDIGNYLESKGMFSAEEVTQREDLEGYLFPDTYWVNRGDSLDEVLGKMTDNFQVKTEGLKVTPEVVIMASILEKELQTKEDKEIASGILWKRLEIGMALQVDSDKWTYDNPGLPPAPICNPGLDSILAALNPKNSSYWYYLSTPDGQTIFSKTLEEHNAARAKYLTP